MKAREPLALMIVQELERLRHDVAEMTRLIPDPPELVAAEAKEVQRLPARISSRSKRA